MDHTRIEEEIVPLSEDLAEVSFDNLHLTKRFHKVVDALMESPSSSFPDIFPSDSDLEGAYRFLRNPNVTWQKAIVPHIRATRKRASKLGKVLVLHDTTSFQFSGEQDREGLGFINQSENQGFFGHFAFAVSGDDLRLPLGVLGLKAYARLGKPKRTPPHKSHRDPNRESLRWGQLVEEVEEQMEARNEVIHVMDREADIYELFDELCFEEHRFVIRLCHDRALKDLPGSTIKTALEGLEPLCEREVKLSQRVNKRGGRAGKINPSRETRTAKLAFSATTVRIRRPLHHNGPHLEALDLNVVHVQEVDPPIGEKKVEWKLITTESIEDKARVIEIVDIYRTRWLIEEYFKALKTGCSYEKRQLESLQTLLNALALFVPVAHRLLLLRNLTRTQPHLPADKVLTQTQITILRLRPGGKLPQSPSVRDALMEVARLGGHIKNNGDPGWLTIWRGYRKLLMYEVGWRIKSDQ